MRLFAVKTKEVKTGDNLVQAALNELKKQKLKLENKDILAFTSKARAAVLLVRTCCSNR